MTDVVLSVLSHPFCYEMWLAPHSQSVTVVGTHLCVRETALDIHIPRYRSFLVVLVLSRCRAAQFAVVHCECAHTRAHCFSLSSVNQRVIAARFGQLLVSELA